MRRFVFLFILFLMIGASGIKANNIDFKTLAPDAVVAGEQFRLAYSVNAEAKDLRLQGDMPDFDILMGPSQSTAYSTQIINGKTTSEVTYTFTYILVAKKEGTFTIPAATVKVKNATYTSNAKSIKVLPPDQAASSSAQSNQSSATGISKDDIFIRMNVSKRSVYEQEGILVTFKLYAAANAPLPQPVDYKFPDFEKFLVQEIELPEQRQWGLENYNGKNYRTVILRQDVIYPQQSGTISIKGTEMDVVVQIPVQQRARSIFDVFDNYRKVNIQLTSPPVNIEVKPLPSGKPASFSGGVGEFTMSSSISSNNIKANEAVTITVKINGTGNMKLVRNPEVKFPNDFEIFDPNPTLNTRTTAAGVSGTKTIEYMAIPRFGGEFEIPPISFSYFDLKNGTYKTITSEAYKLNVEKGEGDASTGPVVSNFGTNRESVRLLGQDIRYLKVKGISFVSRDGIFFGSLGYYLWYLIPILLFIAFFIIYRKQVKENANIALVRTKKANKTAVKRLKNAGRLMKENKKEEFYDEVLRTLWGYLSDKLNIPQAHLTKDNVEIELSKYGVDENLIKEFMDILHTCEFARYAPAESLDTMDKLYDLTVDAIGKMENTIKK